MASSIAFAAAHAQQVRAQRLAQKALTELAKSSPLVLGVHPRDLFDASREPSVIRLAPLAQLAQGLDQFFGKPQPVTTARRNVSVVYYFALKVASWTVYFGLPLFVLWWTYSHISLGRTFDLLLGLPVVVATVPMLHVFYVEVLYVREVAQTIASAGGSAGTAEQPEE